jgi:ABC-type dipeptide/oligopeptide/nickel transport system permease component
VRLAKAILLRLLFGALSLLFVSFVTFVADEIAPGDAATVRAGEKQSDPGYMTRLRAEMELDKPMLVRYGKYIGGVVRGDFGESYYGTREQVSSIVMRNLPMTLKTATMAILLAALIGITLGTFAAVKENRAGDRTVLIFSTLGVTIPNFVLAPLLVWLFALQFDILPLTWEANLRAPEIYYLILPVFVLSLRPMAMLTRLTRASMVETMKQEFIRLAVAKGVRPFQLITRHALRNAILPVITAIGTSFGFLLTGSFVVERFFTIPGLGREAIEAIQRGDMPVVQACILVTGFLFIAINMLVDVLLPLLDPRIRESQV